MSNKGGNDLEYLEVECYIENEDWDAVLEWATKHHDTDDDQMLQMVIRCYVLCAEQHMPAAALNLGTMYYNGRGMQQDFANAMALYEIAAEAGELRAICNLGYCYSYGRGCAVDYEKAHHYFVLGAILYNDANCLYKLGDLYLNGHFVEKNSTYAFQLYDRAFKAVSRGDQDCLGDIQFRVGKCFLRGLGTEQNVELANDCFHAALANFYKRRKNDPFVGSLIQSAKKLLAEAEALLDAELMGN